MTKRELQRKRGGKKVRNTRVEGGQVGRNPQNGRGDGCQIRRGETRVELRGGKELGFIQINRKSNPVKDTFVLTRIGGGPSYYLYE